MPQGPDADLPLRRMADAIPERPSLDGLRKQKAQVGGRLKARREERREAYDRLFELHKRLALQGLEVQALQADYARAVAAMAAAQLAEDDPAADEGRDDRHAVMGRMVRAQAEFSATVAALERRANDAGDISLKVASDEALLRTLDERILIMERRKLAAGVAP